MKDRNNCGTSKDADSGAEFMEEVDEPEAIMSDEFNGDYDPWEPASGMAFPSKDAVKSFYKMYACNKGFGIMIRNSRKRRDGKLKYFILSCSRVGNRSSSVPNTLKNSPAIKDKCKARITVSLKEDGLWHIKKAALDHSHELGPTKMSKINKTTSMHMNRTIEIYHEAGIRMDDTVQSLVYDAGRYGSFSFVEQDTRNYAQKERRAIGKKGDGIAIGKKGDGKALMSYFLRMQEQNINFFYDIDLDDNFHVNNVFWADARSRATYDSFGDVITFDTTYLTNRYDVPLVTFVGVNHHGQSVLLGCGLLSSEDIESFVWLFKSWLRCMSGNPPKGIVTDQCKAIQNAIQIVFPTTRHRWCLWHIMKKIHKTLKIRAEYKNIKNYMKSVVYDTFTKAEFEARWGHFIKEFKLQDNEWLSGLYNERHRWVPIFLKMDFWAGMSTTHWSESIHAFFDGYIDSTTSLYQFVKQYDNALHDKAEKEFQADCQSSKTTIHCESNTLIEMQFQSSYTHAKFIEVQAEFIAKMNCSCSLKCVEGSICVYNVLEETVVGGQVKEAIFDVVFNCGNHDVSCKCLLFEFRGIMCRHLLVVLSHERVKQVPSKYILSRWSKNIKRRHAYIKSTYDVMQLKSQMRRYDSLCKDFYEAAEVA